eukprot:3640575-Heterocapsa_arctica.AAC.1
MLASASYVHQPRRDDDELRCFESQAAVDPHLAATAAEVVSSPDEHLVVHARAAGGLPSAAFLQADHGDADLVELLLEDLDLAEQ